MPLRGPYDPQRHARLVRYLNRHGLADNEALCEVLCCAPDAVSYHVAQARARLKDLTIISRPKWVYMLEDSNADYR